MELPKAYNAKDYEDAIYEKWLASGYFNPDTLPENHTEPYAIMMPPPNVTGVLHLGHALENSLMDIQARYKRMQGKKVLLLPGTDHAAVATQARVENNLKKAGMKNPRKELGREGLLKEIQVYAEQSKSTILNQIKKMGTSADWDRLAYTFDEPRNAAVNEVFKRMYKDGLIYRGHRLVNWDWKLKTTVSDDELVSKEEKGTFYFFQYGPFVIGTVRPETKFGDKYVVMHPNDKRYAQYMHGQQIDVEWINGKITATIIKDESVDPEFGTGVMTITPWHDAVDFAIAERHKLDKEQIIDFDGRLLPIAQEFSGMTIAEARPKIVEKLKAKGLLVKVDENYLHGVTYTDRGGVVMEPQIKEQWFVDVNKEIPGKDKSLKDLMRTAVTSQAVHITPSRFQDTYLHWIDNLRDWCISRQIWWGHRIPVWYRGDETIVSVTQPAGEGWVQDEDTLDTWFSSGMWTFSTLGWPSSAKASSCAEATVDKPSGKPSDFETYHPTAWMQMGHEILFFWMARMIMMSMYLFDEVPFKNVYIHGILRDKNGKKFSKSLGNGIDPLDIIKTYGTDALRLSLIKGITPGNDARFYEEKVEDSRNFVNKLWNVTRFVVGQSEQSENQILTIADRNIQSKLQKLIVGMDTELEKYRFSQAADDLYNFVWHEFADKYVEVSKKEPNSKVAKEVLETVLKLAHPFIPFVTEAIWQELGKNELLMISKWPEAQWLIDPEAERIFDGMYDIVTQIRDLRAKYNIAYSTKITLAAEKLLPNTKDIIEHLTKVVINEENGTGKVRLVNDAYEFVIDLTSVIDVPKYTQQLEKEIADLKKYIAMVDQKLTNPEFSQRAPAKIVEAEQKKLAEKKDILEKLEKSLHELQ